ncbi:hypothetical protein M9434_006627 [Picochlorum sp. BPE23]|nr:hypothetical protein M9434_006627 [Picochlorum sp. BPE23]
MRFFAVVLPCALLVALGGFLEVSRRVYVPQIWNGMYEKVYDSVVWLPESEESVAERFDGTLGRVGVQVYMLNLTNVDAVRHGSRARVERIGPYVFRKSKKRARVSWLEGDEMVEFTEGTEYEFVGEESVGNLTDVVHTLNIPLVGAIEMVMARSPSRMSGLFQLVIQLIERWSDPRVKGIFMCRTVEELLFGYDDPLLSKLSHFVPGINSHFSLLHNMTAEEGYLMKMKTGKGDIDAVTELTVWNGVSKISAWESAEIVRGTDGRQFPPAMSKALGKVDNVTHNRVWVAEAYRSVKIFSDGTPGDSGRLKSLRYLPANAVFSTSTKYHQNVRGLFNISSPINAGIRGRKMDVGPKLFLSLPGFCNVDALASTSVDGIQCDADPNDQIYLDVEPMSGITVNVKKSLMLSVWFGDSYNAVEPKIVNDTFLPVMEVTEHSRASDTDLKRLSSLQTGIALCITMIRYSQMWSVVCVLLGVSMMIAAMMYPKAKDNQRSWQEEDAIEQGDTEALLADDNDT